MIQTLDADMPMFTYFAAGDFEKFLDTELEQRKIFGYPQFGELVKLTFSHVHRPRASYEAQKLADILSESYKLSAISYKLLGPSPAFIPRERRKWKFVILLKFT